MATKARVLCAFKEIHRTCQSVYAGNGRALKASRWKINTDFRRFKDEACPKQIENHIQLARDASRLVGLTAVQGARGRQEMPPSSAHSGWRTKNNGWQSERRPREEHFQRFYDNRGAKSDRNPNNNFQRFDDDTSIEPQRRPNRNFQRFDDDTSIEPQRRPNRNFQRFDDDTSIEPQRRPNRNFQRFDDDTSIEPQRRPNRNFQRFDDDDDDDMSDEGHWAERGSQKHREAWGSSEYPDYTDHRRSKPHHKKKAPRYVDSANFDLSKMTGQKR